MIYLKPNDMVDTAEDMSITSKHFWCVEKW